MLTEHYNVGLKKFKDKIPCSKVVSRVKGGDKEVIKWTLTKHCENYDRVLRDQGRECAELSGYVRRVF